MNYNSTLNLPKTGFNMKANLPVREPEIQKFWEDIDIYSRVLENNSSGPLFMLHDGPPYANGHIHMGHALNRTLKDIVLKSRALEGYRIPFVPGWDCHGLPVEYEVLKKSGKKDPGDRLEFRKKAADYAMKFVEIQKKEFRRLGLFGEWDNPYLTLDQVYEEKIVDCFKQLYLKGYIFRELKPVHWCISCRTALAEAEIEYSDIESPSVFIKFEMLSGLPDCAVKGKTFALVWTTTPWTLPSNTALCFHPEYSYSFLEKAGEYIITASQLAGRYEGWSETGRVKGTELEGCRFRAPFGERISKGILADFVTLEDGTGIVHIAPGHGEEDYRAGKKYSLEVLSPVDASGRFTAEAGLPQLEGKPVFESDQVIIGILEERGLLLEKSSVPHSYPHCWRCKSPVIFRATRQWFLGIDIDGLRGKVLDSISGVKWKPPSAQKRITAMVENRPDWCLSRQRLWGVPIPVFHCRECESIIATEESFDRVRDLVKREGSDGWFSKEASEILGEGFRCSCGSGNIYKENDILDVWFDSGVSSFAVLDTRENHSWPADMYIEGSDQHRGWFQTSIIPAVGIRGKAPYRSVLTHGFIVDSEGKKMSKSLGNVKSPQEVVSRYGADLLRLWVASEDYSRDIKISDEILSHIVTYYRRIRNSIRFILGNTMDLKKPDEVPFESMTPIDRFILHKFHEMSEQVRESYESCVFHRGTRALHEFCNSWLSSFYFNILKDRLYVLEAKSQKRRSSQTALRLMGENLLKLIAPILSHTAEEGWQTLREESCHDIPESVFLSGFKSLPQEWHSPGIAKDWELLVMLREAVLKSIEKAKDSGNIKDPLETAVLIRVSGAGAYDFIISRLEDLKEYFIVSSVKVVKADTCLGLKLPGGSADIEVSRASGGKCTRCWLITDELPAGENDGGICRRCSSVVDKQGGFSG